MERLEFPQPMVHFLNALYANQPAQQEQSDLVEHLHGLGRWLKEQQPLLVGGEEEQAGNLLRWLGRELSQALSIPTAYSDLEEICGEFALALAEFRRLRSRLRFVDFVEFDQLMQSVVALSKTPGAALRELAQTHLQRALHLLESLSDQIAIHQAYLPGPVQQALSHGLSLVDEGILAIHAFLGAASPDARRGLLLLRKGSELLGYFVRWRLQECGWNSPQADHPLWCEVNRLLLEVESGAGQAAISRALPRLHEIAQQDRQTRMIHLDYSQQLWQEWDLRLRLLSTPRQASPGASLQDMLALVEEMQACSLHLDHGFATFLENLLLAGEGCWASTLPDSLLARELRALFPRSAQQPSLLQGLQDLRDYLDSAHRPALHEGLQTLLNCAQSHRQPEVVLGGLRCRCCQRLFNPNDPSDRCLGQSAHQYLQVCA